MCQPSTRKTYKDAGQSPAGEASKVDISICERRTMITGICTVGSLPRNVRSAHDTCRDLHRCRHGGCQPPREQRAHALPKRTQALCAPLRGWHGPGGTTGPTAAPRASQRPAGAATGVQGGNGGESPRGSGWPVPAQQQDHGVEIGAIAKIITPHTPRSECCRQAARTEGGTRPE